MCMDFHNTFSTLLAVLQNTQSMSIYSSTYSQTVSWTVQVKTYMLREKFHTLNKAIAYAVQEEFSLRESQANNSTYRPARRQEYEGFDTKDLCYV